MNILAVTGFPILHSKSPQLFDAAFTKLQAIYTRISASDADEAIWLFQELNLRAMNVTSPIKSTIIPFLDKLDKDAKEIGAVNLVAKDEGGNLHGFNTDHIGVIEALKTNSFNIETSKCTILGAGGAGKAAAYALQKMNAEVYLINRTHKKALDAATILHCHSESIEKLKESISKSNLLISTLPAGTDIIPSSWLRKDLTILDANYKNSTLEGKAKQVGANYINGEAWLLNQAIASLNILNIKGINQKLMEKALQDKSEVSKNNISIVGFMGAGKSTVGNNLASKTGFELVDTDLAIEDIIKIPIHKIFKTKGEKYFRQIEKSKIKEITNSSRKVYSCGGGSVLDSENRKIIKENSIVIWLYSSIDTALERINNNIKRKRPLLEGEHKLEKAKLILDDRLPLYAEVADIVINTEGKTFNQITKQIYDEIDKTQKDFW